MSDFMDEFDIVKDDLDNENIDKIIKEELGKQALRELNKIAYQHLNGFNSYAKSKRS